MRNLLILLALCSGVQAANAQTDSYSTLYNKGAAAIGKQDYANALIYFNQAIQQKPDYAEAIFGRGTCFLMLQERDKACFDFMEAEKLHWAPAADYRQKYCSGKGPSQNLKPVKPAVSPGEKTH